MASFLRPSASSFCAQPLTAEEIRELRDGTMNTFPLRLRATVLEQDRQLQNQTATIKDLERNIGELFQAVASLVNEIGRLAHAEHAVTMKAIEHLLKAM